jgi:hypothetical protein
MRYGVVADIIADARPDFIFGDGTPSFFHRNDGGLLFTNIAGAVSNVSINQTASAGIIVADYDNNGTLDIIVARGGSSSRNQLFRNNGTSVFTSAIGTNSLALLAGIQLADGWRDFCAGDVNNDGRLDLWIGRDSGAHRLYLNMGDLTGNDGVFEFADVAAACGVAGTGDTRVAQMADLDGDGDLDLFAGHDGTANAVYRNEINNHRSLTVLVHGAGLGPGTAAHDGIGARVELLNTAGTTVLATREINGGRGLGSQDPLRAHFGVTPSEIYTVRVTFVSGAYRTVSNVVPRDAVNQTITVNE